MTWRLVETSAVNEAGKAIARPYGPKPQGLLAFGVDGRMMCVLCDGRSDLPEGHIKARIQFLLR